MDLGEEFKKRTQGMGKDSKEYLRIVKEFNEKVQELAKADREHALKAKMAMRIVELLLPAKKIYNTQLTQLHPDALTEIGKAAKALHDKLDKYGLVRGV